jgi:hypothetical protein
MVGSATATLLSYGAMATTLGVYSKKVMEVPYRLPESFGLMAVMAGLVFLEPVVMDFMNNGWLLSKILITIIGLIVITIYMKALLPSSKTDSL